MAQQVTDANFQEIVMNSEIPVMVDFWAEWCGPCRMVGPIMDQMSGEYEGKALIVKLDVDSNPGTAGQFGVRNIPTVLFIKGGEVADKQVGAVSKDKYAEKLDALI